MIAKLWMLSSASIFIEYAEHLLGVKELNSHVPDLIYNVTDNHVNVVWSGLNGIELLDNNTLFTLELYAKQDVLLQDEPFFIDNRTVFTDMYGTVLDDAYILMDVDIITDDGYALNADGLFSIACHPNPVKDLLNIKYNLPENADVQLSILGSQGQIVSRVLSERQLLGQHSMQFDLGRYSLKAGIYFVRIVAVGDNVTYNETVRIVVMN